MKLTVASSLPGLAVTPGLGLRLPTLTETMRCKWQERGWDEETMEEFRMAITATDILFKLSVSAAAGNTTAQPDPNASLGDQISTTQITDATLHNLFDVVTGDENAASDVEYRCLFVHNAHASLTWESVMVWLSSEVAGGASAAIGLDTTAASAVGSGSAQAVTVANESTAPAGASFSAPTTKAGGLSIGNLTAGQVKGIWVRRTAANTAAVDNDGVTIRCEGDTAA